MALVGLVTCAGLLVGPVGGAPADPARSSKKLCTCTNMLHRLQLRGGRLLLPAGPIDARDEDPIQLPHDGDSHGHRNSKSYNNNLEDRDIDIHHTLDRREGCNT